MSKCKPSPGFNHCIEVSVLIKAPPGELYEYAEDMEMLGEAFPMAQFKKDREGPLELGEIYYSKGIKEKKWTEYKVIALEKNKRISGELVGKHRLLKKFRFDHLFIEVEEGTISEEKVEYSLQFGIIGKLLNALFLGRMFKKIDLQAHQILKEKAEKGINNN